MLAGLNENMDLICGQQTSSIKSDTLNLGRMSGRHQPHYSTLKSREPQFVSNVSTSGKAM